ncbi:MAG: Wzt carbohydrate-binding domain-containing protein [Pseudomonadota bacterium]|nr:Wzt carbohydrate-binding domain-containing protein [Pseudomonadota bacterium]
MRLLHENRSVDAFISESVVTIVVHARFETEYADPHVGFQIRNSMGEPIFMTNTHCMGIAVGPVRPNDEASVSFEFRAAIAPGDYSITAGVANDGLIEGQFREALSRIQDVRTFTVLRNVDSIIWSGVYNLAPVCSVERRFARS